MVDRSYQKDGRFSPWGPDPRFQPDGSVGPSPLVVRLVGRKISQYAITAVKLSAYAISAWKVTSYGIDEAGLSAYAIVGTKMTSYHIAEAKISAGE